MKKRNLVITYNGADWGQNVPFHDIGQRQAYEHLYSLASAKGFTPYRAAEEWFDGNGFVRAWTFERGQWKKVRRSVRPDIVLDKSSLSYTVLPQKQAIHDASIAINRWEFDLLASDKLLTQVAWSAISPQTFLVRQRSELRAAVEHISSAEVIIKPRLGHGGKGIRIMSREAAKKADVTELSIVQPVIDTSKGIPGLYTGIHDFRIVFAGEKPIISYIRTPAPGTKLCNISQGGGVIFVPVSQIPDQLKPTIKNIMRQLAVFPHKIFSLDFFFNLKRKPFLVEVNTKPIIHFPAGFEKQEQALHKKYIDYCASIF